MKRFVNKAQVLSCFQNLNIRKCCGEGCTLTPTLSVRPCPGVRRAIWTAPGRTSSLSRTPVPGRTRHWTRLSTASSGDQTCIKAPWNIFTSLTASPGNSSLWLFSYVMSFIGLHIFMFCDFNLVIKSSKMNSLRRDERRSKYGGGPWDFSVSP